MLNGMPWETPDAIGRQIDTRNLIVMGEAASSAWHQRLFCSIHPAELRLDVKAAMVSTVDIAWSVENTGNARYQGIVARCAFCQQSCRVSWNVKAGHSSLSSAFHMYQQRNMLCSFLKLEPMATVVPNPAFLMPNPETFDGI